MTIRGILASLILCVLCFKGVQHRRDDNKREHAVEEELAHRRQQSRSRSQSRSRGRNQSRDRNREVSRSRSISGSTSRSRSRSRSKGREKNRSRVQPTRRLRQDWGEFRYHDVDLAKERAKGDTWLWESVERGRVREPEGDRARVRFG